MPDLFGMSQNQLRELADKTLKTIEEQEERIISLQAAQEGMRSAILMLAEHLADMRDDVAVLEEVQKALG
jgi:hypothetical protein